MISGLFNKSPLQQQPEAFCFIQLVRNAENINTRGV